MLYDLHSAMLLAKQHHDELVRATRYRAPLFRWGRNRRDTATAPAVQQPRSACSTPAPAS